MLLVLLLLLLLSLLVLLLLCYYCYHYYFSNSFCCNSARIDSWLHLFFRNIMGTNEDDSPERRSYFPVWVKTDPLSFPSRLMKMSTWLHHLLFCHIVLFSTLSLHFVTYLYMLILNYFCLCKFFFIFLNRVFCMFWSYKFWIAKVYLHAQRKRLNSGTVSYWLFNC